MTIENHGSTFPIKNIGGATISTPGDREIVITRVFDAPRGVVFEAWTRAEHVIHWWDPSGTPLAVCELDLRPGGAFRWVHRGPDGSEGHVFAGVYREVIAPEKLVFTVQMFPNAPEPVGRLVFSGDGEDQKRTRLTMTIECATKADREALLQMRVDAGTVRTLENLAAYLPAIA